MDRLIADGCVIRPARRGLPEPLALDRDAHALGRALEDIRGER
ncbi:MAG: hypothetical protein ACYDAQ_18705 [Mycobacteriales bacterium]